MSLFVVPASCGVIKPLIIEDAANVGTVDATLRYNASVVNVTGAADGAFQTNNFGLNRQINLASITLDCDSADFGSLSMTVNTLKDATP